MILEQFPTEIVLVLHSWIVNECFTTGSETLRAAYLQNRNALLPHHRLSGNQYSS